MSEVNVPEKQFSWNEYFKTWAIGLLPFVPTIRQHRRAKLERGKNIEAEFFWVLVLGEITVPLACLLSRNINDGVATYITWRAVASAIESISPFTRSSPNSQ